MPGAGALAGVWYRLNTQITSTREFAAKSAADARQDLAEYKLQVAKEYATTSAIKEFEVRIMSALDRLGDRFENFIDNRNR